MKIKIHIHPATIPTFVLVFFTPYKNQYFIFYIFIFLHELSHALVAFLLKEKCDKIHLFPWGCMLNLVSVPDRAKSIIIFLAGPLFNLLMYALKLCPKANLALALFNLVPVMPLDGGVLLNIIFPEKSFIIALIFVVLFFFVCLYNRLPVLLPCMLFIVLIFSEKNKFEKNINSRVISHFFVEKKAEKLYNTVDKV